MACASTRVSVAEARQEASPWDVTPISVSTPPICAKAGPPESPLHVCDGMAWKANVAASALSMTVAPLRLRTGMVSPALVVPNPTMRIDWPASAAAGGVCNHGTGTALAGGSAPR